MKRALVFGTCTVALLSGACNPNLPNPDADAGGSGGVATSFVNSADSQSSTTVTAQDVQTAERVKDAAVEIPSGDATDASVDTFSDAAGDATKEDPFVGTSQSSSAGATSSDDGVAIPSQSASAVASNSDVPGVVTSQTTSAVASNSDVPGVVTPSSASALTSSAVPGVVTPSSASALTSSEVPGVDTAASASTSADTVSSAVSVEIPVPTDVDAGADSGIDDNSEPVTSASTATSETTESSATSQTATSATSQTAAASETATSATAVPSASIAPSATSQEPSLDPRQLFNDEEFGGNGRTCLTCHGAVTGTITPAEVQALYNSDPNGPLFRPIDSDDGVGSDYSRLLNHATVRVGITLPTGVTLTASPSLRSLVFNRSIPTTLNTPALDSVLMWDGRAPDLMAQALDAIDGHAQATVNPTSVQLDLIAEFEQSDAFFSSPAMRTYSQGGAAPTLPAGNTAAERSGRRFFVNSSFGVCGQCHGGPMLNTTTLLSGLGAGTRFQTVSVSEFNSQGNPVYGFTFPDPKNASKTVTVDTPDPGRALITGKFTDVNKFKIPSLWGITKTAPYFHDNSSDTLEALMDHYQKFLATFRPISDQDKSDILAYLKLL